MTKSAYDRWDGRFYYYALVRRGGASPGKRASTRMAVITDCTLSDDNKLLTALGFIGSTELTGWSTSKRDIDPADIVKSWRSCPGKATIAKEKRKVAVAPEETLFV